MDVAKTERPSLGAPTDDWVCTEFIRKSVEKIVVFLLMKSYSYLEATYVVEGGAHGNISLFLLSSLGRVD